MGNIMLERFLKLSHSTDESARSRRRFPLSFIDFETQNAFLHNTQSIPSSDPSARRPPLQLHLTTSLFSVSPTRLSYKASSGRDNPPLRITKNEAIHSVELYGRTLLSIPLNICQNVER